MDFQQFISDRRDGKPQTLAELKVLANGAASGDIPDYQLAAWLMAEYFQPLSPVETSWLTLAMAESGERLDRTGLPKPWIDKHSTGGVGDKASIVVLPILASCGLAIVKMSGRGLGITGGTVDKLSAIPGLRLDLSPAELKAQAARIGLALSGQTPNLAPADKALYALRDVTATVDSMPLIVSSILSKKLAGGADLVVLDVKCGRGAFAPSVDDGRNLADLLAKTAASCGIDVRIALSDMNQPLGSTVGNALEIREAIRVLGGEQSRFSRLCLNLAGLVLEASGLSSNLDNGIKTAGEAISSGKAQEKAREWFLAQGAKEDVIANPGVLPTAAVTASYEHRGPNGWLSGIDAAEVGRAVIDLGGGRRQKTDLIDLSVGVELHVEVGSEAATGLTLFTVHAKCQEDARQAIDRLASSIKVVGQRTPTNEALIEIL